MIRYVLLPGAVLIACAMGGFATSLWVLFHSQFQSNWHPDRAYAGDVPAQRHLARCYTTGCRSVPRDPAFACAWRQIISSEDTVRLPNDLSAARQACSRLSVSDRKWITPLENDIRARMREEKERLLKKLIFSPVAEAEHAGLEIDSYGKLCPWVGYT
jgi:hypothetical protein